MSERIPLRARDGIVRAYAIVDQRDYPRLAQHAWRLSGGYAVRNAGRVLMHRQIMGLAHGDGRQVDHENRNRLDNRRSNLRVVTNAQNGQNLTPREGTSSRHRGVSYDRHARKWRAKVTLAGVRHYLGYFEREEDAAGAASRFRAAHMPYSEERTT